jgi:hypothetical protein
MKAVHLSFLISLLIGCSICLFKQRQWEGTLEVVCKHDPSLCEKLPMDGTHDAEIVVALAQRVAQDEELAHKLIQRWQQDEKKEIYSTQETKSV